jgi:hypothetical protein
MEAVQELATTQDVAQQSETVTEEQSVTEQTAATDATETQSAETDEQKNAKVQQEEKQRTEKRQRGVQKRMDELTRDKYAERQAREALQKQNEDLIALVKGGQAKATPSDGQPKPDQYADYQEYVRADAVWHAEQRAKALFDENLKTQSEQQRRQQTEQSERTVNAAYMQRQREVAKTIPDFDETMAEGAQDISVPNHVFDMIRKMPNGPLVAYHMVKNPTLADQFFTHPPELHGILLGQLSATLKGAAKISNAPPPGKPAQAKTGTASEPPEDTDAYMAWADKHMR